jgi:hypothetical protein
MEKRKTTAPVRKETNDIGSLFEKTNLRWMLIGAAVMAIGFLLMAGGRSEDPNIFNKDEVYGFRRITLAPIVILIGLVIEIYALFRKPRKAE